MAQTRIAPPAARAEGQWAFDQTRAAERQRAVQAATTTALNVRAADRGRLLPRGLRRIAPEDLRGRMRWWGLYTQRKPGIDGGKTATLEPHELDDEYFMLRVRFDGGSLSLRAAAHHRGHLRRVRPRHRRRHRPAEHPAALDPRRGRPGDLAPARGRRAEHPGGVRRHARASSSAPPSPASRPTRSSTAPPPSRAIVEQLHRRPASSPTCRASSRPRSAARRTTTSRTRSTTSRSSACVHPELGPGFDLWVGGGLSTNPMLGRAARRLRHARARSPTSGRASSASSATTATAGCAPARA